MSQPNRRADRQGAHRTAFEKNKKIILATQDICGICGQPVDKTIKPPHPMSYSIDHIIPVKKGGHPSDISNLQLAHRWCNIRKSDKMQSDGFRLMQAGPVSKNNDLPQHYDWAAYDPQGHQVKDTAPQNIPPGVG